MSKDYGDMYQYILESKKVVRNIKMDPVKRTR